MKQLKHILYIFLLTGFCFVSCTNNTTIENQESDAIVTKTVTDENGIKLEMSFNNPKERVTINFNGERDELFDQKPASGIWYKNDTYELRGKGEEVDLTKEGELVFTTK